MNHSTQNSNSDSEHIDVELRHAQIDDDQLSIQSISEVIYSLFEVENGTIKLSGCSIEPTPVLKLKLKTQSEASEILYFSDQGEMEQDFARSLGLDDFEVSENEPSWLKAPSKRSELDQLIENVRTRLESEWSRVFHMTVYWCKAVDGKLTVSIGDATGSIKFSCWAKRLVDGLDTCPPYLCEHSGKSAYQIVADDLGNLTVPAAMKTCELTNAKIVESQIAACSVSNRQVAVTELWTCPATGKKLLQEYAKKCAKCNQSVSPDALERGFCIVCRSLSSTDPVTPAIQQIQEKYPFATACKNWKESTCQSYSVVACRQKLSRFIFVIDLTDGEIVGVRKSNLLGMRWKDFDASS